LTRRLLYAAVASTHFIAKVTEKLRQGAHADAANADEKKTRRGRRQNFAEVD
jgi:hypothetical protein